MRILVKRANDSRRLERQLYLKASDFFRRSPSREAPPDFQAGIRRQNLPIVVNTLYFYYKAKFAALGPSTTYSIRALLSQELNGVRSAQGIGANVFGVNVLHKRESDGGGGGGGRQATLVLQDFITTKKRKGRRFFF